MANETMMTEATNAAEQIVTNNGVPAPVKVIGTFLLGIGAGLGIKTAVDNHKAKKAKAEQEKQEAIYKAAEELLAQRKAELEKKEAETSEQGQKILEQTAV